MRRTKIKYLENKFNIAFKQGWKDGLPLSLFSREKALNILGSLSKVVITSMMMSHIALGSMDEKETYL